MKYDYHNKICLLINNEKVYTRINKYLEFPDEIIMSTIVKNEDNYLLQWINYHMSLGVTRFIIYDNSTNNTLSKLLETYILNKTVLLFRWSYPYRRAISGISGQTTQQNHSVYAFQNSKYIGLLDIDEYVNPQQNYMNINDLFNGIIKMNDIDTSTISGFKLLNKFFHNPNNMPVDGYNFLKIYNCEKVSSIGHEKNFVIPKNVKVFAVHMVTLGKPIYSVDDKLAYFNHYYFLNKTNRGKNNTNLIDDTISTKCVKI